MWQTVLRVGGEGGSLTLKGLKLKDGNWLFTRIRDEGTMADLLPTEDLETLRPLLKSQSKVVSGLEEGLSLLNHAWPRLYGRTVHPEFAETVWDIVSQSEAQGYILQNWAEVCFPDREEASKRYAQLRSSRM